MTRSRASRLRGAGARAEGRRSCRRRSGGCLLVPGRRRCAGRQRQYIETVGRDKHRVLPLRRQAMVGGDDRPAVGEAADAGTAGVDHRSGKDHSGRNLAGARSPVMQHLRPRELPANVSAELAHDGEAGFQQSAGSSSDVAQWRGPPRGCRASTPRTSRKRPGLDRRRADVEHAAGVPRDSHP